MLRGDLPTYRPDFAREQYTKDLLRCVTLWLMCGMSICSLERNSRTFPVPGGLTARQ